MKRLIFLTVSFLIFAWTINGQSIGQIPYNMTISEVGRGFSSPVDIANVGDDRLFIVERSGRIRILNRDGSITQFLDIDDRVINTGGQSEQGLLALEFHHDFDNTNWFFVHYTDNDGNTVISRFEVDAGNPNLALADSEKIIFTEEQPFGNHNGGTIKFGADNMLYIGLGDGGSSNDPQNFAQNRSSLLGKMLRIDIDNGDPYSVPADNPFVNDPDTRDEIWAIGLRNPWKFSFDRSTGDLWIGDVGQRDWEEINFQSVDSEGGENYGWRCREGNNDAITSGCSGSFDPAVAEYNHEGFTHCSVTGGYVYRGAQNILEGAPPIYFYADYCSGSFWGAYPIEDGSGSFASEELNQFGQLAISTFGEDNEGELYIAALNNGRVYRLGVSCNIDVELQVSAASCVEASDGAILLPEEISELYDVEIINLDDQTIQNDPAALPPGNYEIIISRFGCERIYNEEVVLIEQAPLQIEFDGSDIFTVLTEGVAYSWFIDGALVQEGPSNELPLPSGGGTITLTVEVELANGCVLVSSDAFFILNSIEKLAHLIDWKLSPNPVEDVLTVSLSTYKSEKFSLTIADTSGKIIQTQDYELLGQSEYKIDMKDLASGVYLLMISDGKATQTEQFVKH